MKLPPGHVPGMAVQHKATAYGGIGQKMLEKMGWEKGQGLGKEKHGMKEAIEVKKKEDTLGVSRFARQAVSCWPTCCVYSAARHGTAQPISLF